MMNEPHIINHLTADNVVLAKLPPPGFITEGTFAVILSRQTNVHEQTTEKTTEITTPITTPITTLKTKGKTRKKTRGITRGKTRGIIEGKTRGKNRDRIIELIRGNNMITIPELAEALGITDKGAEYHITNLKKEGIINREGPAHGGKWIIIKP
jgi:predicted HTH transcriptional regulator